MNSPPLVPVSLFRFQQPGFSQILHGPADGGFGVFEVPGNGGDGGPAGIVLVGPVGQVDVDRHCPVGQVLAVQVIEISHGALLPSLVFPRRYRSERTPFREVGFLTHYFCLLPWQIAVATPFCCFVTKGGYWGTWNVQTAPITQDTTIRAVYRLAHMHTVTFVASGKTVKTLSVPDGYTLKSSDYPEVPQKTGYDGKWKEYTAPVTADITIQAVYTPGTPVPTLPTDPGDLMSLEDEMPTEAEESEEPEAAASEEVAATSSSPAMILVSTVTEQHSYIYASGRLLRETITTTAADGTVTTEVLDFAYDAQGTPYSLTYTNGTASPATYYYITNLQGDVTQLIDSTGKEAASYSYDPYGKVMSARGAMAETNPLRYRGYYYDADTELYYLQSRYYDANVCRFINADSYSSTGTGLIGYNMFSYCNNDPVKNADSTGNILISTLILIGSAAVGVICAGYTAYKEYKAGYQTADIIFDSIGNGLVGFSAVCTLGTCAYQCYLNFCALNAITPVTSIGPVAPTATDTVNLYRAMSPEEYSTTVKTQTFSAGPNSYSDSKFFATTYDDANTWGSRLFRTDPYVIMNATMDSSVLTSTGTQYWERLDSIGPAYLIPNQMANRFTISIK